MYHEINSWINKDKRPYMNWAEEKIDTNRTNYNEIVNIVKKAAEYENKSKEVKKEMATRIEWKFQYTKVIFNNPATIVLWKDGTKTTVKCGENDIYDPEKGLALCFMKKALGNTSGNLNKVLHKETDGFANAAVEKINEVGLANPVLPEEFEEVHDGNDTTYQEGSFIRYQGTLYHCAADLCHTTPEECDDSEETCDHAEVKVNDEQD